MKSRTSQYIFVFLVFAILFIPWLGELDFYSKGEPREAIVAVSMLSSGDWVLPVSHGTDIPYKPPFLAWLIALCSIVFNNGTVNEFTSRLPSAIAGIALLIATWRLVRNRYGRDKAWIATLILGTSFEFLRACSACRVDMVLTCCMVGAIYAIYTMHGKPIRAMWAILLLSAATLTKGPVGSLLPCLAMGIFFLVKRHNFFKTLLLMTALCLASFILPALWYWAAYNQGGQTFADLAWEENIGRLIGAMGYDSHIKPWYYNFLTLASGMLPWTLPIAVALFVLGYRKLKSGIRNIRFPRLDNLEILSLVVFLTVLVFYTIPQSKRSVYLLPCYPFMAIATMLLLSRTEFSVVMRRFAFLLAILTLIVPIVAIFILGLPALWALPSLFIGLWWIFTRSKKSKGMASALFLTYILFLSYNAVYAPKYMNQHSDRQLVEKIENVVGGDDPIYAKITSDSLMRFYTINFYMNDRLRQLDEENNPNVFIITDNVDITQSRNHKVNKLTDHSCDTRNAVYLLEPIEPSTIGPSANF